MGVIHDSLGAACTVFQSELMFYFGNTNLYYADYWGETLILIEEQRNKHMWICTYVLS